jgi:ribokinase
MNTLGSTYMLGQVGDDGDGETYIEHFNTCNVKNDHIRKVKGVATGAAYIVSNTKTGENSIIVVGGANLTYGNDEIVELSEEWTKVIQSSNVLLLQREIPEKINIAAAMAAKTSEKKVLVVLDMGGQDDPLHPTLITLCDMISPNTVSL